MVYEGELAVDFWKKAGEIADLALRGTAGYLEHASKSASWNKNYTEEQREYFQEFSERMGNIRENGVQGLVSIDNDDECYDEYDEYDEYDNECYDEYDGNEYDDEYENYEQIFDTSTVQKQQSVKQESTKSKQQNLDTDKKNKGKKFTEEFANKELIEKEKNRKIRASIKAEKEFVMKIEKIQYAEKRSGSGFILSGLIEKGGIYQAERMQVIISHRDGIQSQHRLISISCNLQHKKYNYAKKGQYVRLFIEEDKSFNIATADSVCEVIYH